jgi:hypothetical protein
MKKGFLLISALIPFFFSIGCGNIYPSTNLMVAPEYATRNTSTLGFNSNDLTGNYDCDGRANILSENSVTGDFEICGSKLSQNTSEVLVVAKQTTSDSICVFPATVSNSNIINWVQGTSSNGSPSGIPLYTCSKPDADGQTQVFFPAGTRFNAALIINVTDLQQMKSCIQRGLQSCPEYAYGKFR